MSKLNVNEIQPVGGGQTVTVTAAEITASSSTITASSFVGDFAGNITGNVTGNATGLTGTPNVVVGIVTATTINVTTLSGISTISASSAIGINQNLVFQGGNGIDFSSGISSTTATSHVLDDYEEGTWTPVFADAMTAGNVAGSYTNQLGRYTKIGRQVNVQIQIDNADTSGLTGGNAAWVTSFPFVIASGFIWIGTLGASAINFPDTPGGIYALANASSGDQVGVRLFAMRDNTSHGACTVSSVPDANNSIYINMIYYTT